MSTAQEALKAAVREALLPALREQGFKGSAPTWRKGTDDGDWAVVNVQSSSFSTRDQLRCVINVAVAPEPWLRWSAEHLGPGMPKAVNETLGLYRELLHPKGTPVDVDGWWEVSDQSSANQAAADMKVQLAEAGWPVLDRLLSRDEMLRQVRAGHLGWMKRDHHAVFFARAEALLLMDGGDSGPLNDALARALDGVVERQKEHAERFDRWVRQQAVRNN